MPTPRDRRLIAFLAPCGDPGCGCCQPQLEERWLEPTTIEQWNPKTRVGRMVTVWEERSELIWKGTFLSDPSPSELEMLREELREVAAKHDLEEDRPGSDVWERAV